jgi:hypothetical protein
MKQQKGMDVTVTCLYGLLTLTANHQAENSRNACMEKAGINL